MENTLFENRSSEYQRLLEDIASKHDVDANLLQQLIVYEQGRVHLQRRRGAKAEIKRLIEQNLFDTE